MSKSYPGESESEVTPVWWCRAFVSLIVAKRNPREWRSAWKCGEQKDERNGGANKCEDDEGPACVLSFSPAVLYRLSVHADNANEQLTTITVSGLRENTSGKLLCGRTRGLFQ